MSIGRLILQRLIAVIPMLFGAVTITFFIAHLIPGNPVYLMVGGAATKQTIAALSHRLGFDQPLYLQYVHYLAGIIHGDLGTSLFTGAPVTSDIASRFPATFELITLSLVIGVTLSLLLGVISVQRPGGIADRIIFVYSFLAGATADFWLALILVFVFYTWLGWAPAPLGRLGLAEAPPHITGMYLIDSLLTGDWAAFQAIAPNYILPVAVLALVYSAPIMKMVRQTMYDVLQGDVIRFARACGLPTRRVVLIALRNSLPPIITIAGITYGYLLGGAVLVETVFSWGGLGQYAVESITQKDFVAIQGFVLVAATFSIFVYLLMDIAYIIIDPRVRATV